MAHKKHQRVIYLGKDSGVQVFKAEFPDQLANELLVALVNAIRKINKQERLLEKYRKFGFSIERNKQ
jgi:hypothetical protein